MSATITTTTNTSTDLALMLRPQDLHHHTTVDDLPNELLLDVSTYLSLRTILSLRQVNRRWRAVVSLAATAGLPETTKKLLNAWLAWNALTLDDESSLADPLPTGNEASLSRTLPQSTHQRLTDIQRDQYVALVGRYAISYQCVSREEPGLSNEFLEWLYEWPSCASLPLPLSTLPKTTANDTKLGLAPLCPASVVNSLTRSFSYCTNPRVTFGEGHAQPSYYYQEHIIFLIALEDDDVLLPRVRLHLENVPQQEVAVGKGKQRATPAKPQKIIKCSMLNGGPGSFAKGDWARFLPISTVKRAPGSEPPLQHDITNNNNAEPDHDGDPKTPLPLYVLSGSGLGERLAGSVCILQENAELKVIANSWADYLMFLVKRKKISMQIQANQRLHASKNHNKDPVECRLRVSPHNVPAKALVDKVNNQISTTNQVAVQPEGANAPTTNASAVASAMTKNVQSPTVSDQVKKIATSAPPYSTNEGIFTCRYVLENFVYAYAGTVLCVWLVADGTSLCRIIRTTLAPELIFAVLWTSVHLPRFIGAYTRILKDIINL